MLPPLRIEEEDSDDTVILQFVILQEFLQTCFTNHVSNFNLCCMRAAPTMEKTSHCGEAKVLAAF